MTAIGKPAQIMDALFAHAALLKPLLPVAFPESNFIPPANGRYLRISFFGNKPKWEGVASGVVDQGLLQVSVVWPKSEGLISPANIVSQVRDHFAKGTVLSSGSINVKISNDPWMSSPMTEDNDVSIPITVPWTS